ncbi:MAG: type II toxin-antitoxin system RelE/ParE family toxin [Desulfobacterales bacterium]
MTQKYSVVWSNIAENDLKKTVEYIADDSLLNTLKIVERIKQKASSLYTSPERGRIVPELRDQGILQFRELAISPWRILYRIPEKSVLVLAVLDSRHNIEDVLLKRLTNSDF